MKTTYNRTLCRADLTKAEVDVLVYEGFKWEDEEYKRVTYTGLTSWDMVEGGKEAEEIESMTDESGIDEYHEYIVLHFEDGTTATFRNSHVELFIY